MRLYRFQTLLHDWLMISLFCSIIYQNVKRKGFKITLNNGPQLLILRQNFTA